MDSSEFDVLVTVTGFRHYPNARRLFEGEKIILKKEPQNEYDSSAIAVFLPEGKIGYIANNSETVRQGTISATALGDLMEDFAQAEVVEGTYHDAVCKVEGVFDIDKITLKAFGYYDEGEYDSALKLFIKISEKYNTAFLMQYIADCLIKLSRFDEALPTLEEIIEKEPESNPVLMMYATVLEKLGRYDEALDCYARILAKTNNKEVQKAFDRCKTKIR
ncbi:MAG: tetratricopeptide repeat protein [Clostridia bacterium]|nr:tetratricopeptide repeat protein [Clostridia bacterium]